MQRHRRNTVLPCCLAAVCVAGCQLGPTALSMSRIQYNKVIQKTAGEELLLNLVRLKYREQVSFLQVGSVSAQFVFEGAADITGTLREDVGLSRGNPNMLEIGGGVGYTERPTITYSPLSGQDFAERVLSPINLKIIALLIDSGWRIDRVLRLTVGDINGLDNAGMASGPTPKIAPTYRGFLRAIELLRALQKDKRLHFHYEDRHQDISDPIPASLMTADAVVKSAEAGTRFRLTSDRESYVLTRDKLKLFLRFDDTAESEHADELRALLELSPLLMEYELASADRVKGGVRDESGHLTQVALDTRSLLGSMFFLSQGVEAPEAHAEANLITTTLNSDGTPFDWKQVVGELMTVHSQRTRPRQAAVAVKHMGYWFYIADDDLNSKSTFSLLGQIFALRAGGGKGAVPTLTLDVGG